MAVQPGPLIIALRGRNATTGNDYYHLLSLRSTSPEIWSRIYLSLYAMQGKTFYLSETPTGEEVWEYTDDTLQRTDLTETDAMYYVTDPDILQLLQRLDELTQWIHLPIAITQPAYMFELYLVT
jgi:hypothetical protein